MKSNPKEVGVSSKGKVTAKKSRQKTMLQFV